MSGCLPAAAAAMRCGRRKPTCELQGDAIGLSLEVLWSRKKVG